MGDTNNIAYTFTANDQLGPIVQALATSLRRLEEAGAENLSWLTQMSTQLADASRATSQQTQSTNQLAAAYLAMAQATNQQTQAYAAAQAAALQFRQQQAAVAQASQQGAQAHAAAQQATLNYATALQQTLTPLTQHLQGTQQLGQAWSTLAFSGAGIVTTVLAVSAALVLATKEYADQRLVIRDLGLATGLTVAQTQVFYDVLRRGNIDIETSGQLLVRLRAHMAEALAGPQTPSAQLFFDRLGLKPEDLQRADEALIRVSERIVGLINAGRGAEAGELAQKLFGRNPREAIRIAEEVVRNQEEIRRRLAGIGTEGEAAAQKQVQQAEAFTKAWNIALTQLEAGWRKLVETFAAPFTLWLTAELQQDIALVHQLLDLATRLRGALPSALGGTISQAPAPLGPPAPPSMYQPVLAQAAERYGIDPTLLARLAQGESNFDPNAVSNRGARGLLQVMPFQASRRGMDPASLFDPAVNADLGAKILSEAHNAFQGMQDEWHLAIAAYNAGVPRVQTLLQTVQARGETPSYGAIAGMLPAETRRLHDVVFPPEGAGSPYGEAAAQARVTALNAEATAQRDVAKARTEAAAAQQQTEVPSRQAALYSEHYRDALRQEAEQLQTLIIARRAALIMQQQGAVAAEEFARRETAALAQRRAFEQSYQQTGRTTAEEIGFYQQRIATLTPQAEALAGARALEQARIQLPQITVELARVEAFMDRASQSLEEQARQRVLEQGAAMQQTLARIQQEIRVNPALSTRDPELLSRLAQLGSQLSQATAEQADKAVQAVTQQFQTQLTQIALKLGEAGLTPLEAQIQKIREEYARMRSELEKLIQQHTALQSLPPGEQGPPAPTRPTPQLVEAQRLAGLLDEHQQTAIERAQRLNALEQARQFADLNLQITGSAESMRAAQLAKIDQFGVDMTAKIKEIQEKLPPEAVELQRQYTELLGKVPGAVAQRRFEQTETYHEIVQGVQAVQQLWSDMWSTVFDIGAQKGQDFGVRLLQSLQRFFSQIASGFMNAMLNAIAGTSNQSGGWMAALVGFLSKVVIGAVGGGTSGGGGLDINAGGGSAGPSGGELSFAQGGYMPEVLGFMQQIPRAAQGMVVNGPQLAWLGDNASRWEAAIPLDHNRSVPVTLNQRGGQMAAQTAQPIVIQVDARPHQVLDPRAFKSTPDEIRGVVHQDIVLDGLTRKLIIQYTR